ncbi:MAG: RES family NAD+ phosphorylase [Ignavibacteriae bacterium]|nr:RES family NAD+ phosphorylase [Ignavibacteriota bacterium]
MKEFNTWKSYRNFAKTIRYDNRYFFNQEIKIFLDTLIHTRQSRINKIGKGTVYWRAQLGCQLIPKFENGKHNYDIQLPYPKERMKPLPNQAKEGRANPAGIPYLYVSTNRNTALAEVRPWIGSEISLAKLKTNKDLTLIDCSKNNSTIRYHLDEPNPELREQIVWADIDNAFSKPITSADSSTDYIPTQIISELFRNHGYDGIIYKSTLGKGLNITLFNLECAEIIDCQLYNLEHLSFKFTKTSGKKKTTIILRNSNL